MKKVSSKFHPFYVSFLLIVVLFSCRTETIAVSGTSTRAIHTKKESSGVPCGGDPTPMNHWVREFRHSDANEVLVGFETRWAPGADPFRCDRLHQFIGQGIFRFDLRDIASRISFRSYRNASIIISNYVPENGQVAIRQAEPWDNGGFSTSDYTSHEVFYELKQVTEPWDPAVETWGSEPVRTAHLANNDVSNLIRVPFQEGQPYILRGDSGLAASIDVTEIVRNILAHRGEFGANGIFGFALESWGPPLVYKTNNRSVGTFRVQLAITYER